MKTKIKMVSKRMIVVNRVLVALFLASFSSALAASPSGDLSAAAEQAIKALKSEDSGLTNFFNNSAGYVIFPSVDKAGIVIGGEYGKGLVFENGNRIGEAIVTEINVVAQAGGQNFYEVIFFETAEALANFKKGKFELSAEVSAVAATDGASKNAKYRSGVTVFTLPTDGLMFQATVGGQKFKYKPYN